MATIAKSYTRACATTIVRHYTSAVLSGIVPDAAHLDNGGYHVSIDDLRRFGNAGDYSNTRPLDKAPPVTPAGRKNSCALDVSLGRADMVKVYANVERVWKARATDTRAKYINAINVWSGKKGVRPVRFNFQKGTKENASKDHEWHGHGDWPRVYVDDGYNATSAARAARAMASTWIGQTHDAWQRQEKLGPYAPKPPAPKPPATSTPEDDDTMICHTHQLPAAYAYDAAGKPLPGRIAAAALVSVGLPPAGHPEHRWGKDYSKPYLSLVADAIPAGTQIRVAIHDGAKWHPTIVTVKAGARQQLAVPAPATQAAYNITIGRVQPKVAAGGTAPEPAGTIGLLVEMLRK
jgi:hypothetical protein